MKSEKLYEDKFVTFDRFEDGVYRVTFFDKDLKWSGDITMSPKYGVIFDNVRDEE